MDRMLRETTAGELAEWEAFAGLEPFGSPVEDHRAGVVASTIANCNRAPGGRAFEPSDFFPSHIPAAPAGDVREQAHAVFGAMLGEARA